MIIRRPVRIVIAVIGCLCCAGALLAQSSANFDLSQAVLSGGGGTRQSTNFAVQDALGQTAVGQATSPNHLISAGFLGGDVITGPISGDEFEIDDKCSQPQVIAVDGPKQAHTFHDQGDQDWLKFAAQANKTYVIEVTNLGPKSDAVIALHDTCDLQLGQGNSAFGATVTLAWDSLKNGDYYVKLQQFDPSVFGADANYEVSVRVDNSPPSAPQNPRCVAINSQTLGLQWKKSPERDVRGYRIQFTGAISGNEDVQGGGTTYYELGGLTPDQTYALRVRAVDFSSNESPPTGEVQCTAKQPDDTTQPSFSLEQPAGGDVYTTTAGALTFNGSAQDPGNNLSRARVRNVTKDAEGWDYSLTGGSDSFRVADLPLGVGNNNIQVTVLDGAGNSNQRDVAVRRLGGSAGAVIIIAGHNETFGLQNNIYNSTNRAYRIFKSAGYSDDNIFYIAPVDQDADGDSANDVDANATPASVQQAITVWAAQGGRVGPDKPLLIYMMDHGFAEKFCVTGCSGGKMSPDDMDGWLRQLETATGVDEVTIVIEACQSGSFIDRVAGDAKDSLSKEGRVVITSTSRDNNAYASAQGAYFSDAFFSCLADSNNLKACFDQGRAAVIITGVAQDPWLDDNGDGLFNAGDGSVAQGRIVTQFFSSIRPEILTTTLARDGVNGTLTATVDEGAEELDVVWAAVFPPSFHEPDASAGNVTLNLGVPTVRLEADPDTPGKYRFNYNNGFLEEGDYRIVFYAQDRLGIQAAPKLEGEALNIYLPVVNR